MAARKTSLSELERASQYIGWDRSSPLENKLAIYPVINEVLVEGWGLSLSSSRRFAAAGRHLALVYSSRDRFINNCQVSMLSGVFKSRCTFAAPVNGSQLAGNEQRLKVYCRKYFCSRKRFVSVFIDETAHPFLLDNVFFSRSAARVQCGIWRLGKVNSRSTS